MSVIITILVAVAGGILWLAAERPAAYGRFTALFLPLSRYSACTFGAFETGALVEKAFGVDPVTRMIVFGCFGISLIVQLAIFFAWAIGLRR